MPEIRRWVHSSKDFPDAPHFAIIEFSSIFIPGDERSKTNPGHGYPDHQENTSQYIAYFDEQSWKDDVERKTISHENFVAFKCNGKANIKLQAIIKIINTRE